MEFKILVILSILIAVIFSIILLIFTVCSVYRDAKNTNLILMFSQFLLGKIIYKNFADL